MKKYVELDGQKILSVSDFHEEIKKKLDFPDYYGNNLDALWDCLTGHIDTNINVVWKNHLVSKEKLGHDFSKIMDVFSDLKHECSDFEISLD